MYIRNHPADGSQRVRLFKGMGTVWGGIKGFSGRPQHVSSMLITMTAFSFSGFLYLLVLYQRC